MMKTRMRTKSTKTTRKKSLHVVGWTESPDHMERPSHRNSSTLRQVAGICGGLLLWVSLVGATQSDGASELMKKADGLRTYDFVQFTSILGAVESRRDSLTPEQREFLRFLEGWKSAYEGDEETALARLTSLMDDSKNPTLRLRAGATAVNVLN